jgi:hypothetical protein
MRKRLEDGRHLRAGAFLSSLCGLNSQPENPETWISISIVLVAEHTERVAESPPAV